MTNNKQITASMKLLAISEWRMAMHYQMANGNFAALRLNRFIVISRLSIDLFDLIVKDFSTTLRFGRNDEGYIGDSVAMRFNRYSLFANASQFATRKSPITPLGAL